MHTANVYHRDLKPKNILANADCKLKICDFGLARPSFHDSGPTTVFWTDYVATRWYRAPELCGSFFTKYTPAIDIWSIGCIFAEILNGKPLFPGKNVVHQLEIITDLLGTPAPGRDRQGAQRKGEAVPREHAHQAEDSVCAAVSEGGARVSQAAREAAGVRSRGTPHRRGGARGCLFRGTRRSVAGTLGGGGVSHRVRV